MNTGAILMNTTNTNCSKQIQFFTNPCDSIYPFKDFAILTPLNKFGLSRISIFFSFAAAAQ
jgi:hypothetical protein